MKENKNRLSFQAHLSRHPHDVSAGYTSSLAPGMIIPQWFDVAQPGDKYKFKAHMFARFQDIVTAFLGEVDIHLDYFFVPLQMIYTPFGQIFAQTDDILSSTLKSLSTKGTFPLIDPRSFTAFKNSSKYSGHVECFGKESARLLDAFDMNPYFMFSPSAISQEGYTPGEDEDDLDPLVCNNPNVAPWILCAYQAIYQKYYRNDEFERFQVESYNVDQYFASVTPVVDAKFVKLRYVQRPADYFTTVRVSPIASAVDKLQSQSSITDAQLYPSGGGRFNDLMLGINNYLGLNNTVSHDSVQQVESISNAYLASLDTSELGGIRAPLADQVSVPNIRAAFALDKFLRIYGRAGKTYDDQILAHFGIKIPHDVKHDLTHIKHLRCVVQSDPVYGTATIGTDNSSVLGQVGGQASGTLDSDEFDFTCPVHGVVMAVAYAVTKPRYFGTFSKLHFLDNRIKFPIPEFDKLGAQPLFSQEVEPTRIATPVEDGGDIIGYTNNFYRIGWQNRYQEFKKKYNRISMIFAPSHTFGVSPVQPDVNNFQPWVLSRRVFTQIDDPGETTSVSAQDLFERPDALNSVMALDYNGDWSNDYFAQPHLMFQTDPLITEFFCNCMKVSWMSETGDPDL